MLYVECLVFLKAVYRHCIVMGKIPYGGSQRMGTTTGRLRDETC